MAEKIATLILTVDLDCPVCYKKIRKAIANLAALKKVNSFNFEEKKNSVTISGPFDSYEMRKKLLRRVGKVIKEVQIKEEKKPGAQNDNKQGEGGKNKPGQNEKTKENEKGQLVRCPVTLACCAKPCYVEFYGGFHCSSCGMLCDWSVRSKPATWQFIGEGGPASCSLM